MPKRRIRETRWCGKNNIDKDYLLNKLFNILTDTILSAWFTKQSS